MVLMATWALQFFEPDTWLVGKGVPILKQASILLFAALAGAIILRAPLKEPAWRIALLVFPPLLMIPFADNSGLIREAVLKVYALYYLLVSASYTFVRTTRAIELLVIMFVLQFGYWGVQGAFSGGEAAVAWHPDLGNSDAFGPLMTIGAGLSFFVGMSMRKSKWRWLAFAIAALCVIGTIASFARGAFLTLVLTVGYVWLRSPNKLKMAAAAVAAGIVVLAASALLFPDGGFWKEMSTITAEGTTEGTGRDRVELWTMAWHTYLARPILGAGPGNFGIYAYEHLPEHLLGGYAVNRGMMYGRALHNVFFEILADYGTVGAIAFTLILVDFWRRNNALRRREVVAWWAANAGSRFDLFPLSLGLECAMVAFLGNGMFYNQLSVHWFWSILAINGILSRMTKPANSSLRQRRRRRLTAPLPAPPPTARVSPA